MMDAAQTGGAMENDQEIALAGPAPRPALSGHLRLVISAEADGRSAISAQSFRAPFHVSKPYWDGSVLQVQVVNPTAGMLEGDRLDLEVVVERNGAALITTPAASRAFMMRSGAVLCRQSLVVRGGSWLDYLPEPLFPHRDACYTQNTRVEVEAGGEAVFCDAFAPGRVGRGERWAWRRLCMSLDIDYAGEPVLRERFDSSGAEFAATVEFHRTPDAFFASLVVVSERLLPRDAAIDAIRGLHGGGRWVGISALRRGGWIIRVIAPGGQALRDTIAEIRALLTPLLPRLGCDLRKL